jgi:trimeric autotransporter adhesin
MRRSALSWTSTLASALILLITIATDGASQSFQGGLRGAVTDANSVIPGVIVTLINQDTSGSRTTVSNERGEYVFAAVQPGTYTVRAALQGFKTFERQGLTIGTQQFITLDLVMELGTIEESISVTADAPLLETSNASLGEVLDKRTLDALPALNRNAFMTAVTVPTVIATGDPYFSRMEDQSNGSLLSLGGGPRRGNNYLLDGVAVTDLQNRTSVFVSTEAINEVKVQVHTYDAEMGRSGGGVFNTTGKSGSNAFHGSAFIQNRPNWAAANNFFAERAGNPKITDGPYYRYWGGSLGGPVIHNKTFFWAAHEGYRTNSTATGQLIMPTDLERIGDFSRSFDRNGNRVVIYDPLTTRPNPSGSGYVRDAFPGNVIPPDRISTVARNITRVMPHATEQRSGADGISNYQLTSQIPTEAEQYVFKGEHKLNDKVSITGLYLYQNTDEAHSHFWGEEFPYAGPDQGDEVRRVHVIALNNTIIASPTTVVTLRYGWTFFGDHVTGIPYDLAELGFNNAFVEDVQYRRFPNGNISGYTTFGTRAESPVNYRSWALNSSVSKSTGRHTFKYGADFRQIGADALVYGTSGGNFNFDKEWTQRDPFVAASDQGNAFASFLLGLPTANPSSPSSAPVSTPIDAFIRYYAGYVQDDFRFGAKLTLNFGLRYEYESGLRETENRFTVAFDRDAVSPLAAKTGLDLRGGLRYAGQDGFPDYQGDPSKKKISPRLGFAWSANDKTVLRGGYGLYWSPWAYSAPGTSNWGQLGYTRETFTDQSNRLTPTAFLDNPFPNGLLQPNGNSLGLLTGVGSQIDFVGQGRKSPYVQQFSLDVQRQIPADMAVSLGYSGSRGDDLSYGGSSTAFVNINQLDPKYLSLGAALQQQVANPFYGIPEAGAFAASPTIARGQLLRPYPQFGNIRDRQASGARSRYHAVIAQLEKRLSHGWGGRFNYTWSRLDDDVFADAGFFASGYQGGRPLNNYDLAAEYSRSFLDLPHRVVLSPIVELPFGAGKRWATSGLADLIAGGWTFTAIATYESGQPLNVTQDSDNSGSFSGVQRPNWTGADPVTPGDVIDRLNNYINPGAYQSAAPFTFGTGPRTDPRIRSPFRTNYDMVLAKTFGLGGPAKAQIRIEFLNATNNPKFQGGGDARLGRSTFGTITTQAGFPRTGQFLFRVSW